MSTEKEFRTEGRQVNVPALVEAVKHQVLRSVAQALISESPERALASEVRGLTDGNALDAHQALDFYDEVRRFEIRLIEWALVRTRGKQCAAARLLGIKATTLNGKIKLYNLNPSGKPAPARDEETTCSPQAG